MLLFPKDDESLLTPEFCLLMGVAFLAFCNISLFYGLNDYLEAHGIPSLWRGVLIGLEPCTALVLRPFISPFLSVRNSVPVVAAALLVLIGALCSYSLADSITALALVRIVHGFGFVLLLSALATLVVAYLPAGKTGQGFGVFAIAGLLPYTILPPVVERLLPLAGSEPHVYALFAPVLILALLVVPFLYRRVRMLAGTEAAAHGCPTRADILKNLRSPGVGRLMLGNGLLITATTVVFFFIKDRLTMLDMGNAGLFFSVSSAATISVRVFCGRIFDRTNRFVMLFAVLVALSAIIALFGLAEKIAVLLMLAGAYGTSLGFAIPQFNAAMFEISPPQLRGFNTNMILFTMDVGYVVGPLLAGGLLSAGMPTAHLFVWIAICPLLAGLLIIGLRRS